MGGPDAGAESLLPRTLHRQPGRSAGASRRVPRAYTFPTHQPQITREPGPVPGLGTKIVACTDPDGYKVVFVDGSDFLAELRGPEAAAAAAAGS